MKAHRKLLEQLIIGAKIARINAPFGDIQRVRIDMSVEDVDALVKEAKANRRQVEDLETQINCLHIANIEGLSKMFRE